MPDLHLLHANYELRELRDGIALLRNAETAEEIELPLRVNLNDGFLRIEASPKPDPPVAR